MKNSNWQYDDSKMCGDLNTGDQWKNAEHHLSCHLSNHVITDKQRHFLVPVLFFIDATHCDHNGHLKAEPVLCTVGNISLEKWKEASA